MGREGRRKGSKTPEKPSIQLDAEANEEVRREGASVTLQVAVIKNVKRKLF